MKSDAITVVGVGALNPPPAIRDEDIVTVSIESPESVGLTWAQALEAQAKAMTALPLYRISFREIYKNSPTLTEPLLNGFFSNLLTNRIYMTEKHCY